VRTLARGTMQLDDIYELCRQHTDVSRANGLDIVHGRTDRRWQRPVRNALQTLRETGTAHRIGRATWLIEGSTDRPRVAILVLTGGTLAELELRLEHAVGLSANLDGPADLIVTDPPYGLMRGSGMSPDARVYQRDQSKVVGGYVDIDPAAYEDFTWGWLAAAAGALPPAGQIAVITGPQRSAVVQYIAEHVGLAYINQVIARKGFRYGVFRGSHTLIGPSP
jgi:hypothetical protein